MQTSNHALLRLVAEFPCHNDTRIESFLHDLLQTYRIRGEWFQPDPVVFDSFCRCRDVFMSLDEDQNVVLCGTVLNDGWLYRRAKGWDLGPIPAWLRNYNTRAINDQQRNQG
jgi:hypothetical protein